MREIWPICASGRGTTNLENGRHHRRRHASGINDYAVFGVWLLAIYKITNSKPMLIAPPTPNDS